MKKLKQLIDLLFKKLGYLPTKSFISKPVVLSNDVRFKRISCELLIARYEICGLQDPKAKIEEIHKQLRHEMATKLQEFEEWNCIDDVICNGNIVRLSMWVGKHKNQ
ncbi:hypothetical protein [Solitalea canadensis]|uniref:Uncharacterized protein n=1 Tax=Solitalea canadensis (strain ATCC 29591 / DSM 3403 / JCM 21819 / LMG 8368 / NBRC 15130 / NCIMB 12057 / USAM 9D) TaxID=929556 RepID=H8KPT0_SOLCM|nr:hypothetical protein [Solitalea canadensis]AFD05978.1 hypothetical protein Solca_0863 [Solitalea canadensis DSM 3403]